ncbi:cyclin-dependent kinase inhibitor 1-like [Carcharodon carcharias]|uniref:cyclin-dependent kinase inhibitor 1-like n=1 Tax=Carcharodon carcharias TaxID=13397 RepID=UPI001B7F70EA|nr:cyclin-dependent kinase inhibitor 1-like [Carcharodon carcharias]
MDEAKSLSIDVWQVMVRKPGKVCRNLFGPVNRDQVKAELRTELRNGLVAARNQWAFDFEEEQPVQGAFQWEAVSSQDVPRFYRTSVLGARRKELPSPLGLRGEAEERKVSPQQDSNPLRKPHNRKRKQTVITDFYALKRRFEPLDPESKP